MIASKGPTITSFSEGEVGRYAGDGHDADGAPVDVESPVIIIIAIM